ncbi:DUF3558 domain-containing protein [Pseudonocardia sp.]|uniref:DUF3558 domain-containing protein n=1 Tax=Pseudonocardia sp. TaxID=60912 RepID=UPI003D0EB4A2
MKAVTAVLTVLSGLLLGSCTTHEEGTALGAAASEPTGTSQVVPGETDPCGLLGQVQRDSLGVRDGESVDDVQLDDAALCRWRSQEFNGGTFRGGVLPNKYSLAQMRRSYESPRDFSVAGLPAVSGSIGGATGELSCWTFAEMPDGRLADASFWAGKADGMTHAVACGRATEALAMIVETMQSR